MSRSGVILRNFIQAMVGAKEPMPSVSKKFVTAPSTTASGLGDSIRRVKAERINAYR